MKRYEIQERTDWKQKVEEVGFFYHSLDTKYWDESVCYSFTMDEVLKMEKDTNVLYDMCLEAVQYVIDNDLFDKFKIPKEFVPYIIKSWNEEHPSIYGRFDFSLRDNQIKMLEFNADTPVMLLESSVVQWYWLNDVKRGHDQWNSIHEKLIDYWKMVIPYLKGDKKLHFASVKDEYYEDIITVEYLRDTAIQAGVDTNFLYINDIGWDSNNSCFVDQNDNEIHNIFKLYPWEWLFVEEFGKHLLEDKNEAYWIEPAWKIILSNKAILPILYKLFPNSPIILPTYYEEDKHLLGDSYVRKPFYSRQGENIKIVKNGVVVQESNGEYDNGDFIYQELCELPTVNDNFPRYYPLLCSWVCYGESAGLGIREHNDLITTVSSRFVPHFIE